MIAVVGNAYRKQLFAPFLSTKTFGNQFHYYLNSTRILKSSGALLSSIRLVVNRSKVIVVSDEEGMKVLSHLSVPQDTLVYLFCWNGADEVATWDLKLIHGRKNVRLCFLFAEEAAKAEKEFKIKSVHFKFPILKQKLDSKFQYKISYLGEVDTHEAFKNEDADLDQKLWQMASSFELDESKLKSYAEAIPYHRLLWIIKNRLRYQYALQLKKYYGKDMVLVGNDWKKYGLDSLPADYNPEARFRMYAQSQVCIDFLSKSSSEAHYPRSAEIVSHSHGLMQLETFDSEDFLGSQVKMRSFKNFEDLKGKIDYFLSLKPSELAKLGNELRSQLAEKTKAYNAKARE